MSGLFCCVSRPRTSRQGDGYRVLSGRRGLAVSYNQAISSTQRVAVGNAYEAPLVTPSGKPPRFEDFILHKTIGRGSFGRVSWYLYDCPRETEHALSILVRLLWRWLEYWLLFLISCASVVIPCYLRIARFSCISCHVSLE